MSELRLPNLTSVVTVVPIRIVKYILKECLRLYSQQTTYTYRFPTVMLLGIIISIVSAQLESALRSYVIIICVQMSRLVDTHEME